MLHKIAISCMFFSRIFSNFGTFGAGIAPKNTVYNYKDSKVTDKIFILNEFIKYNILKVIEYE